jgi:hypothetical protein
VLPQGIILKINALGLENSMRTKKDGIIYFGFQEDLRNVTIKLKQYLPYFNSACS